MVTPQMVGYQKHVLNLLSPHSFKPRKTADCKAQLSTLADESKLHSRSDTWSSVGSTHSHVVLKKIKAWVSSYLLEKSTGGGGGCLSSEDLTRTS